MTTKLCSLLALLLAPLCFAEDSDQLLTLDHYVRVKSTVPAIAGQTTQIYVRERSKAATPLRAASLADRVRRVAWSLGGPLAGGYAARHTDKVQKLVLLAPAYGRMSATDAPAVLPAEGVAMNTQSHDEFIANWDRQVGCSEQYDIPTA